MHCGKGTFGFLLFYYIYNMKTLSNTIKESVFSNLGLGEDAWIDNWIETYNHQPSVSMTLPPSLSTSRPTYCCARRSGNIVVMPDSFDIIDDKLLDNGYIPDYIHIEFDDRYQTPDINIYNDNFKSLRGISITSGIRFNFCHARSFNDWDTINNAISTIRSCNWQLNFRDADHAPKDIKGLKTKPAGASSCLLYIWDVRSNIKLLDGISGCEFGDVYLFGDMCGVEDKLSGFLRKNTLIQNSGAPYAMLYMNQCAVTNFDFLRDLNPKSDNVYVSCPMPKGKWINNIDTFTKMLDPFGNPKITKVVVQTKTGDWCMTSKLFKTNLQKYQMDKRYGKDGVDFWFDKFKF